MTSLSPLETYREQTAGVVRLMIHYCWRRAAAGDAVGALLDGQVDIKRKTSFHRAGLPTTLAVLVRDEWDVVRDELIKRMTGHRDSRSSESLEEECWRRLEPYIEPVLEHTCPKFWLLIKEPYECWSYAHSDEQPGVIDLHIGNAYQPESPFKKHRTRLGSTLLRLLLDVPELHPEVTMVGCGSWLNEYEPFLQLFPDTWRESLVLGDTCGPNWGWWGQYMTHEGRFHTKNASVLRATGKHPYTSGYARCAIDDVVAHLRDNIC